MPSSNPRARRARGNVHWLPQWFRPRHCVRRIDQLTGKRIQLRETVPARATRRETEKEAEKVHTRFLIQVDERRSPRTEATVNELFDRRHDVIDIEGKTRAGYVGRIEKHIRPTVGRLQVGCVQPDTIEGLYARPARVLDRFATLFVRSGA